MFNVKITAPASVDINEAFTWWSENRSDEQAKRWYKEVQLAIKSLKRMPERCPIVPETNLPIADVRQLAFGVGLHPTHRIIFVVDSETVVILRVRHFSQGAVGPGDLGNPLT